MSYLKDILFKKNLHYLLAILVLISLLLPACGGTQAVVGESWTLVKLLTKGEQQEASTQTVELRNCSVPEKKTLNCSAGTSKSLNVSLGGSVSGSAGAVVVGGELSIDPSVGAALGFDKSSGESLELDPPPTGYINRYEVTTEYRTIAGEVLARSSDGSERTIKYAFQASCSLTVEPKETLPCGYQEEAAEESNGEHKKEGVVENESSSGTSSSPPPESSEVNTSFDGKVAFFTVPWDYPNDKSLKIINSKSEPTVVDFDMFWNNRRGFNITWSPDGSKLVFGLGMDLYLVDVKKGSPQQIYTLRTSRVDDEDEFSNRGRIGNIVWSPNGKQLALSVVGHCGSNRADYLASGKLILLNSDGSNATVLLEDDVRYGGLDWSPDGTKIIFSVGQSLYSTIPCGSDHAKLGILDVSNGYQVSMLAEFSGWKQNAWNGGPYIDHISWSPDGRTILFDLVKHSGSSGSSSDDGIIYEMTSDGSQIKELVGGVSPSWSPDGKEFMYKRNDDDMIVVANAGGSEIWRVF